MLRALLDDVASDETFQIRYRCPGCRQALTATVMPYSPVIAKHECRFCGRVNEVKTRETFEERIADHVAEGKDRNRVAKRKSINISKQPVQTEHGAAFLIGE